MLIIFFPFSILQFKDTDAPKMGPKLLSLKYELNFALKYSQCFIFYRVRELKNKSNSLLRGPKEIRRSQYHNILVANCNPVKPGTFN